MPITKCSHCGKEYNLDLQLQGKKAKCSACKEIFEVNFEELNETKIEKQPLKYEKEDDFNIKPNKSSFIFMGNPILIILLVISVLLSFVSIVVGAIFLVLTIVSYLLVEIVYKKEEYVLTDRKIVYNYGTIFSDNGVEINLDKITQVKCVLGFIQHTIFKTGTLIIKTAGSNTSKIKLKNVDKPLEIYEAIQSRMRKNGFHLQKDKLVQSAKPHWLGVMGELLSKIVISFFVFIYIDASIQAVIEETGKTDTGDFFYFTLFAIYSIIIILSLIFSYLDLKRRTYDVYTDSIFYTEGFLTKHFSFLPMESVSDTENFQSFWSKIFGLHDVVVSSAGSENKVYFKNMVDGDTMMKNIKYLKDNIIMGEKDIIEGEEKSANSLIGYKDKVEIPLDYDKVFKGEYKMSMLKSILIILPSLIFPPAFIVLLIGQIIRVSFTNYTIEESSIEKKFEFLSKTHNVFSVEKITMIKIKKSILDRVIGTMSVTFWSIGSNRPLTFSGIKQQEGLEKNILAKIGVRLEEDATQIPINFNLMNFLKSGIGYVIFFATLTFILLLIGFVVPEVGIGGFMGVFITLFVFAALYYVYDLFFYDTKRYIQKIHTHFLESISGIFYITKNYVLFRNIKGIKSTKYPLTSTGKFYVNVSGEQLIQSNNKKTLTILSNSVKVSYIDNVFDYHDKVDFILNNNSIDKTVVLESKQDVGNSVFGFVILYSLFAFFILLLLIGAEVGIINIFLFLTILFISILGFIIWWIKVKSFNIERNRVTILSGIVYKRKETVLYSKFNFIEKNQGFVNKIFKNGLVKIYTLGSGHVDMVIYNTKDYITIYNMLKKD